MTDILHTRKRIAGLVNDNLGYFSEPAAVDNTSGYAQGTISSGSTMSWSHTVGSGNYRALVVLVGSIQDFPSGVTFNGDALTLLGSQFFWCRG